MSMILAETEKHKYCEKALSLEGIGRGLYLTLGEMLHKIREERLYEPAWESWQEYCMEFKDLSPGSISKMITVYETFVLNFGYSVDSLAKVGGWTKLYQISPYIHSKADAEQWLAKAEIQSRQDLQKELVEAKTGVLMSECKHENTYLIRICEDCGERHREYDSAAPLSSGI